MKKTGGLLKAKREEANLSLSEVALATKINPKVLLAIEAGESEKLPAKTFLKGFIRSYALYLKADVENVMVVFTEETGGAPTPTIHEAYLKPGEGAAPARRGPPAEESHAGMRTVAVAIIALLILAIIGVRELIEKYQKEKVVATQNIEVSPLAEGTTSAALAKAVTEAVTPKIADVPKGSSTKIVAAMTSPSKAEAKLDTKADAKITPTPTPTPAAPKVDKPPTEPVVEAPPKAPPGPAHNELILEATAKVSVDFKVHGESKHIALSPEEVHTIRADADLLVNVSDGGAVNVILNGVERGPAGAPGKPAQVKVP